MNQTFENDEIESSQTNPLEQSQWSAGKGNDFIYCDYHISSGGLCRIHIVFDGKHGGIPTTCDLLNVVVPKNEAAKVLADALTGGQPGSVIEDWRNMTGRVGQTPSPQNALRAFLRAVQEDCEIE